MALNHPRSLCVVCRAIYQTTSLSSGVPSLLVTCAPVPHPYLSTRPPTGHHGHPITELSSPSPGFFFSSRSGGNQRNGWVHCLLPLRTTFVTKCLILGSQETGPCWYMGQQLRSTSCHETSSGMGALADWGQNTLVRQVRSLLYPAHVLPHQPLERNL